MLQAIIAAAKRRYRAAVLADSPVAYWRLGGNANDELGIYNGTEVGGPSYVAGALADGNTAISLNGSTQYVEVADSAGTSITGPLTLEAWIYASATTANQHIVTKGRTDGQRSFVMTYATGGALLFYLTPDGTQANRAYIVQSSGTIPQNIWTHIAATYNNAASPKMVVYVNGSAVASTLTGTEPTTIHNSTESMRMGDGFNVPFSGGIDEVAIYSSALSAARILAHYQAARPPA